MPTALRFHFDEIVDVAVASALRSRGIDATTPSDVGLVGATDQAHARYGLREGRAILTHDPDYLRLHARGVAQGGIVFCAAGTRTVGNIVRAAANLQRQYTAESIRGCVEFI